MLFTNDKDEYRQSNQQLPASPSKPLTVLTPPMSSPASLKRSFADTGLDGDLQKQSTPTANALTQPPSSSQVCSSSPSPSSRALTTSSVDFNASTAAVPSAGTAISGRPDKRAKLTFAEKEARRVEKQFKEQQKMEETRKKEEEKARKDEERRARDVEKEKRKKLKEGQAKAREAERQKKLEEKQKAEEEKDKKARVFLYERYERTLSLALTSPQSQLRLNAFFVQPSMPDPMSRASPSRNTASPLSSRRSSIAEIKEMEGSRERSPSLFLTPQKTRPSEYERQFPPFFLQSHTVLAPQTRFSRDGKGIEYAQKSIDEGLDQRRATIEPFNAYDMLHLSPNSGQRFPQVHAVKNIISKIHGSARTPIDLTESQSRMAIQKPTDLLKTVPMKYLKFFEDYRPPYTGTFTKLQDRRAMTKLCRRPFSRQLPNTNYDYDSEAEWEDPGEGEDLDSEGEEEAGEDEDENDMEGFLDDDVGNTVKKRPLLGELEPACSGICWEDLESENFQLGNLEVLDPSLFKLDILMGKTHIIGP